MSSSAIGLGVWTTGGVERRDPEALTSGCVVVAESRELTLDPKPYTTNPSSYRILHPTFATQERLDLPDGSSYTGELFPWTSGV